MAPIHRRQRSETADLVNDTRLERANKRPRLSTEGRESDISDGDDTVDVLVHDDGNGNYTSTDMRDLIGTQAQFETLRDQDPDEDVERRNEIRAEEAVSREMQQHVENQERANGIIDTVEVINFMCHEHLTIQLGPLINFIVGHNGSGKSAVLTAITLCLGGKAVDTKRGQSLKSFVKTGKE